MIQLASEFSLFSSLQRIAQLRCQFKWANNKDIIAPTCLEADMNPTFTVASVAWLPVSVRFVHMLTLFGEPDSPPILQ